MNSFVPFCRMFVSFCAILSSLTAASGRCDDAGRKPIEEWASNYSNVRDTSLISNDLVGFVVESRWLELAQITELRLIEAGVDPWSVRLSDAEQSAKGVAQQTFCELNFGLGLACVRLDRISNAVAPMRRAASLMAMITEQNLDGETSPNRHDQIDDLLERQREEGPAKKALYDRFMAELKAGMLRERQSLAFYQSAAGKAVIHEQANRLMLQARDVVGYEAACQGLEERIRLHVKEDPSGLALDSLAMLAFVRGDVAAAKQPYREYLRSIDPAISLVGSSEISVRQARDARMFHTGVCRASSLTDIGFVCGLMRSRAEQIVEEYPSLGPEIFSARMREAALHPDEHDEYWRYHPQDFLDSVAGLPIDEPKWSDLACQAVMHWKFERGAPYRAFAHEHFLFFTGEQAQLDRLRSSQQQMGQLASMALHRFLPQRAEQARLYAKILYDRITDHGRRADGAVPWAAGNYSARAPNYSNVHYKAGDGLTEQMEPTEAVIEFAVTDVIRTGHKGQSLKWDEPHYVGWLLRKDKRPLFQDFGTVETVNAMIHRLRKTITETGTNPAAIVETDMELKLQKAWEPIRSVILQNWFPLMDDVEHLTICPDGALWLVPWSAMPVKDGSYLTEHVQITHSDGVLWTFAERMVPPTDLLNTPAFRIYADEHRKERKIRDDTAALKRSVIIADADYDLRRQDLVDAPTGRSIGTAPRDEFIITLNGMTSILPKVSRLPATALEGKAAFKEISRSATIPPVLLEGPAASETAVRDVRNPEILVFSVHAFFLGDTGSITPVDRDPARAQPKPGIVARKVAATQDFAGRGEWSTHPLFRCGLLLSGSNQCDATGEIHSDDGVLTGAEVALMDLRNTRLVVLSACDTGVGDVTVGAGVAGLRQAFIAAGASSVIASLWQVPDVATAQQMQDFFQDFAKSGSAAESLQNAQCRRIETARQRFGFAHPFAWAGFTLTR